MLVGGCFVDPRSSWRDVGTSTNGTAWSSVSGCVLQSYREGKVNKELGFRVQGYERRKTHHNARSCECLNESLPKHWKELFPAGSMKNAKDVRVRAFE